MEKSGQNVFLYVVNYCKYCSFVLDTKYARKELFTTGKVLPVEHSCYS